MAELVLKVLDGANYEDGDVLCAFNSRRIRCIHAEHICWPRRNGKKLGGFLGHQEAILEQYLAAVCQYRFQRTGPQEVIRTDLTTMEELICGPNAKTRDAYMDVEEYVARRRRAGKKPLFGDSSREVWYGGRVDLSPEKMTDVWVNLIEAKTPHREKGKCQACGVKHSLWPAGEQDLKSHLFVPMADFTDAQAQLLAQPWMDESDPDNPVMVKKRNFKANWRGQAVLDRLEVLLRDVENKGKRLDRRHVKPLNDVLSLVDKKKLKG